MRGDRWQQKLGGGQNLKEWLEETPVCSFLAVVSIILFVAAHFPGGKRGLADWGWGTPPLYWRGEWWRLLVNHVHHGDIFHLLFNVWWLMRLGRVLEQVAGTARMALFVLAGGIFIGLATDLTIEPGAIGLSGILYAVFGLMWLLRRQVPAFRAALDEGTIKLLFVWLFLCIALTEFHIYSVANVGHFSGFFFGLLVGWGVRAWRSLNVVGRVALFLPALLLPVGMYFLVHPFWDSGWRAWVAAGRPRIPIGVGAGEDEANETGIDALRGVRNGAGTLMREPLPDLRFQRPGTFPLHRSLPDSARRERSGSADPRAAGVQLADPRGRTFTRPRSPGMAHRAESGPGAAAGSLRD